MEAKATEPAVKGGIAWSKPARELRGAAGWEAEDFFGIAIICHRSEGERGADWIERDFHFY